MPGYSASKMVVRLPRLSAEEVEELGDAGAAEELIEEIVRAFVQIQNGFPRKTIYDYVQEESEL